MERPKSGFFLKVVWLSRWSHSKVPLYSYFYLILQSDVVVTYVGNIWMGLLLAREAILLRSSLYGNLVSSRCAQPVATHIAVPRHSKTLKISPLTCMENLIQKSLDHNYMMGSTLENLTLQYFVRMCPNMLTLQALWHWKCPRSFYSICGQHFLLDGVISVHRRSRSNDILLQHLVLPFQQ